MRGAENVVHCLVLGAEDMFEFENEGVFYHLFDVVFIFKLA